MPGLLVMVLVMVLRFGCTAYTVVGFVLQAQVVWLLRPAVTIWARGLIRPPAMRRTCAWSHAML